MFDIFAIVTNIGVIGYFIYNIFANGLNSFSNDYVFIAYVIFTTLTLPNLISKVVFKSQLVSLVSALSFCYFPIQFIVTYLISNLAGIPLGEILPFGSIFNIILWNILFALFILLDEKRGDYSEKIVKDCLSAILPGAIFSILVAIFIRGVNSVVALDYLQHLTVDNKIFLNNQLCLLPEGCSNLFLQPGYTTFYHIILGNLTTFIQNDPVKTFYLLDLLFPIISSIPLFYIFKKYTGSTPWSQLGVFLSLSVFLMGSYDFVFFIPQTFVFLLFLMILKDRNLKFFELILASILLISGHFIIGTLLASLLWFKYLIMDNVTKRKEIRVYYLMLLLSLFFFVLANIAGFSVEKLMQTDAVDVIGGLTNPYYPNNLQAFWQTLGPAWILIALIYIVNLFQKNINRSSIIGMSYLIILSIFYFLSPTYANKFTIGIGVYASLLIITFLSQLKLKLLPKLFVIFSISFIFLTNFYIQYKKYLVFYTQSNGTVSAITNEDMELVKYLNENKEIYFIVSDPYTQLIVSSLTNIDTLQAQYMLLDTRRNLYEYLKQPNSSTYETLLSSKEWPKDDNFAILYSSRLHNSILYEEKAWLYNMYSLDIDSNKEITEVNPQLISDMARKNKKAIYIGDYFVLFK